MAYARLAVNNRLFNIAAPIMCRIVIILVGHKTTGVEDNFLNAIFCRCGRDIIAQRCGIFRDQKQMAGARR